MLGGGNVGSGEVTLYLQPIDPDKEPSPEPSPEQSPEQSPEPSLEPSPEQSPEPSPEQSPEPYPEPSAVFSYGCVNAIQQFYFDRTVYSSTVTVVVKGAAGGGISSCPGNEIKNIIYEW